MEPNIKALPKSLSENAELKVFPKVLVQTDIAVMLVDHVEFKEHIIAPNITVVDTKGI